MMSPHERRAIKDLRLEHLQLFAALKLIVDERKKNSLTGVLDAITAARILLTRLEGEPNEVSTVRD